VPELDKARQIESVAFGLAGNPYYRIRFYKYFAPNGAYARSHS